MSVPGFRRRVRVLAVRLGVVRPLRHMMLLFSRSRRPQEELAFHGRFLRPEQLVFDVGANRGQSAETYLALGTRVVAFEPQQDLHAEIRQMCRRNPRLTIEAVGLGAVAESRQLFSTSYDQAASFRGDWEGERIGTATVEVSTLDDQIARHGAPDYCKIDVEGWELEVLKGLHQAVAIISLEYHVSPSETPRAVEALRRLATLGAYFCNLREATSSDFLLATPLPVEAFADAFPHHLGRGVNDRYGDIFCALDPTAVGSAAASP